MAVHRLHLPLQHLSTASTNLSSGNAGISSLFAESAIRFAFKSGRKITMRPSSVVYAFIPSNTCLCILQYSCTFIQYNIGIFCQDTVIPFSVFDSLIHISSLSVHNQIQDSPNPYCFFIHLIIPPFQSSGLLQISLFDYNTINNRKFKSALCFFIFFYLSIMLIDSIPTLPPRTTSIFLNSSFISFTTASFFVAVWTNSIRSRLSLADIDRLLP